ncbi:MAG: VCBS repeat-containing protein [Desulfocapsaceae bacterium]|nr:VCBS repeat-containing protein [Desulfocapsaceae bacterium]
MSIVIMMMKRVALLFVSIILPAPLLADIQQPILKWQYGGCYPSWCETGWYSSPAAADLNGDGTVEVIASAYSIVVLDGETGDVVWRMPSGHDRSTPAAANVGRTWPGIVVTDVDGDDSKEIISAHGGGYVSVYDEKGHFKSGWPQRPTTRELRGLSVADLDGDGTDEIVVTGAVSAKTNTWVYEHTGDLRNGWPQLSNDSGYAYGAFNDNAWVDDINNDGSQEIIVPSDVHYICAYDQQGTQLSAHSMYGAKGWGAVGVWESPVIELRGWGDCSSTRAERYRTNFAHGAAVADDLDGNGALEVIVTGNMYDCAQGHPPGKYTALFIFNSDRSRFTHGSWDWSEPAKDTGNPLSESYSVIENVQPNPVVADIDGNGIKEILFSSYDGRIHSFWLDKTEHHNWPYSVTNEAEDFYRFSSEPVVADLDNNGRAEIIFTSWIEKKNSGTLRLGKLHILDYQGKVLHELALPQPKSSSVRWNGALAAPTIANIDADQDYELLVNTVASGFVAYDLPGSAGARVLWRTGRNKQFAEYSSTNVVLTPILPLLLSE